MLTMTTCYKYIDCDMTVILPCVGTAGYNEKRGADEKDIVAIFEAKSRWIRC